MSVQLHEKKFLTTQNLDVMKTKSNKTDKL